MTVGPGELAQWLGAFAASTVQSPIPSIHSRWLIAACISSSRVSGAPFSTLQVPTCTCEHTHIYTYTYTYIKIEIFKKGTCQRMFLSESEIGSKGELRPLFGQERG